MPLSNGSVSCVRYNVGAMPEEPDFDRIPFQSITPGSTVRERAGFTPFEIEAPYQVANDAWAFRVRVDKITVDANQVRERLKELIKAETENAGPPSPQTRRKLRQLAEDELVERTLPRTKIIECYMNRQLLYVGTTAKSSIGVVLELLKKIGVEVSVKTPWVDAGEDELATDFLEPREPGQSVHGCRFLEQLLVQPDVLVEPESGAINLVDTDGAKVSLRGPVINQLDHMLNQGALVVSAKLLVNQFIFTFDGFSYQIKGLKVEPFKSSHWIERLELRMERVRAVWEWLDERYAEGIGRVDGVDRDKW